MNRVCLGIVGVLVCFTAPALATENVHVSAQLSWSATDINHTNLTAPGELNNLYVILRGGVTSFKGAELDLKWNPSGGGAGSACIEHVSTTFRTSTGSTCTFLNRGVPVGVTTVDVPGHLHVAWASDTPLTTCSGGSIVQIEFEFDGCTIDTSTVFSICSLTLLDVSNTQEAVASESLGTVATVLDGGNHSAPNCDDPLQLAALNDTTVAENQTLVVQPRILSGDSTGVTYTAANLPPGASVDSTSGTLMWTPSIEQGGTMYPVTLTATNGGGARDSVRFNVDVTSTAYTVLASADPPWGTQMDVAESLATAATPTNSPLWTNTAQIESLGTTWSYTDIRPLVNTNYMAQADHADSVFGEAGMSLVFNLIRQTTLNDPQSYKPASTSDWTTWNSVVAGVVNHFKAATYPIHYWHIEEEDTFWGSEDSAYVNYLNNLRATILAADPTAKVISMGLSSDEWWWAANLSTPQFVLATPNSWIARGNQAAWTTRAAAICQQGQEDIVDAHSYETSSVLTGKVNYLRSLMTNGVKPLWLFEGGGPLETVAQGYRDSLGADLLIWNFVEAIGNGVERYSRVYKPIGNATEAQRNIAMVSAVQQIPKWSAYESYKLMTQKLGGYTSVTDLSHRTGVDETRYLYNYQFTVPTAKWAT